MAVLRNLRLPPFASGQRIGLLGGSFNPAHEGHRLASLTALQRLGLDRVWWLVTPGNPLKDNRALPDIEARIAQARTAADHPRIIVTGVEATFRTRFTADTLAILKRRCQGARFVWLMGSDNLAGFHRWQNWRGIARMMPFAVIDRPGTTHRASHAQAAQALARWRIDETDGLLLPELRPPSWVFLHGRRSPLSSTVLRQRAVSLKQRS